MSSPVIRVEHVSKSYRLGSIGGATLKEDVSRWWARARGKATALAKVGEEHHARLSGEQFWALQDVSFEVKEGEVLAIIGTNGAGKSTLLKILSEVAAPSSGEIKVKGRIASLLEVGTGFHPELTGRENVFLNGAILGMTKGEIRKKFDEIVDFSGIEEEFIDTPVKRYSSGMYVRLAFAVAAHLEPEILIVDEVLAVGDAQFQRKCLGKMSDVAKNGRTILFVSHNMTAVKSLCSNGILLRSGTVAASGRVTDVLDNYLEFDAEETTEREWNASSTAPGDDGFRFKSITLFRSAEELNVNSAFSIAVELWCFRRGEINLSLELRLASGEVVCAVASPILQASAGVVARYVCRFPGKLLNDELYVLNIMVVEDSRPLFNLPDALLFQIHDVKRIGGWLGKWPGSVRPQLEWTCESVVLNEPGEIQTVAV